MLRAYNLAEADKIVVFLTRDVGIIRATAKGARRLKSKFGAGLEPCTLLALTFYEKENRELVTLRDVEILRSYFKLSPNADIAINYSYLCELTLEFAPPNEPNNNLFRLLYACLEAIAETPAAVIYVVLYFEVWILRLGGFMPELRLCSDCGVRLLEKSRTYLNSEFKLRCEGCAAAQGIPINREALSLLSAALKLPPDEFAKLAYAQEWELVNTIMPLTKRLISRVLEKELRSQTQQFQ